MREHLILGTEVKYILPSFKCSTITLTYDAATFSPSEKPNSLGSTEGVVDLGTIIRNFSFEVKEGKFLLKGVGRSSIVAECDQKKLEGLVNKIVSSTFLELLGCKFEDENGNSVSLGKQLFLVLRDERLYYKHWKGNRG